MTPALTHLQASYRVEPTADELVWLIGDVPVGLTQDAAATSLMVALGFDAFPEGEGREELVRWEGVWLHIDQITTCNCGVPFPRDLAVEDDEGNLFCTDDCRCDTHDDWAGGELHIRQESMREIFL